MSQQTATHITGQCDVAASENSPFSSPISYQPVCQRCFNPLQLDQDFEHLQKTELMTLLVYKILKDFSKESECQDFIRLLVSQLKMHFCSTFTSEDDATTADGEIADPINLVPVRNPTTSRPRFIVPPNSALSLLNDDEDPLETLQSYEGPSSSLDHRLKVNACLFDVLSGRTEVDHPLCQECADTLLLAKQQCLEFQEEEMKCLQFYLSYLDSTAGRIEAKLKSKQASKMKSAETKQTRSSLETDVIVNDKRISNQKGIMGNDSKPITSNDSNPLHDNVDGSDVNNSDDSDDDNESDNNDETVNDSALIDCMLSHTFNEENDNDNYFDDGEDDDDVDKDVDANADHTDPIHTTRKGTTCATTDTNPELKRYKVKSSCKKYGTNIKELEQTLSVLQSNLNELLFESDRLDKQIVQDTIELEKRTEELDRATTQYNDQKLALMEAEEEMQCLESRLTYARSHLRRLQRTNVLNIAFPIWYDGHIGVINGLHLGRLPNRPVGWEEINAAWGQCALLLQCIGKKLNFTFQNYRIVPMGSQSKIIQLSISKEFPLYYTTGGMRLLSAGKFDTAMINFLDCVNQIQILVEHSSNIQLPYRIKEKGKLQDPDGQVYSIRWNGNSEENWTKALKMMLINMKWIIAALSARKSKQRLPTTVKPPGVQSTASTSET